MANSLPNLFAALTVLAHGAIVATLPGLLVPQFRRWLLGVVRHHGLSLAFAVAFASVAGSLVLSEIAHLPPCDLCWYQRVVMYPQVILLGLALLKKNPTVRLQSMIFSSIGAVIAIYHIFLQLGIKEIVPCSTRVLAIPCGQVNFLAFGYVTIPVMALTGFVLLLVLMVLWQSRETGSA